MPRKLNSFQKKCLKSILLEEEFSCHSCYVWKCTQANILSPWSRFELNNLILFHKIIKNYNPTALPSYLEAFDGYSELRSTHLDEHSYVSRASPKSTRTRLLEKSFFCKTHSLFNKLPLEIRSTKSNPLFRTKLESHLRHFLLPFGDNLNIT